MNKPDDVKFIPKGGMCAVCAHRLSTGFCEALRFDCMPKITKPDADGVTVVRCLMFKKANEA